MEAGAGSQERPGWNPDQAPGGCWGESQTGLPGAAVVKAEVGTLGPPGWKPKRVPGAARVQAEAGTRGRRGGG